MSYKIVVYHNEDKQIVENKYVEIGKKGNGDPEYGYREEERTENVDTKIYEQLTERINLKRVIDAFNETEND
jgi:hypothetical protein